MGPKPNLHASILAEPSRLVTLEASPQEVSAGLIDNGFITLWNLYTFAYYLFVIFSLFLCLPVSTQVNRREPAILLGRQPDKIGTRPIHLYLPLERMVQ